MNIAPIESLHNPFYPLPRDYFTSTSYTDEDRRMLRVNACRQWLCQDFTPWQQADAKVYSLRFFVSYYLHPDPSSNFDPYFFKDAPLSTPAFHYDAVRLTGNSLNRCNIIVGPRGSAKSTLVKEINLLELISRPAWSIVYATSTSDNAEDAAITTKEQCYDNQRLFDDWAPEPEFGGKIKPTKGEGKTGYELFQLTNRSRLRSLSANSRLRGIRPHKFRLDDPEYDPSNSTPMSVIRSYMDRLVFKIALPMVLQAGAGIDWFATFVSRRHYAWLAMETRELAMPDGTIARIATDKRFNYWNRLFVRACEEIDDPREPTGRRMISYWPHLHPATHKERDLLGLPQGVETLVDVKERMGPSAFEAEMQGRPGTGDDGTYFGELDPKRHGYTFGDNTDAFFFTAPHKSATTITWHRGPDVVTMPLSYFCQYARLAITCDTSYTAKITSDFKVATVLALTPLNELFVLDMWAGRTSEPVLATNIFRLGEAWHVPSVHVEKIKGSINFFNSLIAIVRQGATDFVMNVKHLPRIIGFNPGMSEKVARISTLLPRFETGKIKLPLFRAPTHPWSDLFDQIASFNPDAERDGGLQNDDHIDTIQMWQFVYKGKPSNKNPLPAPDPAIKGHDDALARLKKGETKDTCGVPLGYYLDMRRLTSADVGEIKAHAVEKQVRAKSLV